MFIDVHCHLDLCLDSRMAIENAEKENVLLITHGVNKESNRKALELAKESKNVKVALGLYPIDTLKMGDLDIDKEIEFIRKNKEKIIAIGEVGLDYKEDLEEHERQKKIFSLFIELSKELDIPIIVHSRKAESECIDLLVKYHTKKVIMHCFSGNFKLVDKIIANGWFLTVPTNVTFSEHFQKIVEKTNLGQLLCETDSPYLHPRKEMNNEPANVIASYQKIAEIKKLSLSDVEKKGGNKL